MSLNLLVIKTKNIQRLATFYSLFQIDFEYHKHSDNVFHFSAIIGEIVFEIYPLRENETADKTLRLGFFVKNLSDKIKILKSQNHKIISYPKETEYGIKATIEDPDGRKIELTEK